MERAYAGDEPPGLLTGDELLRMPWLNPCELVGGRVVRMTPTNPTHGRIEANVAAALRSFARSQDLGVVMAGEVGVFTSRDPDTVRAPDVLFLSHERDAARTRRDGFLDVAPELVVENLSRPTGGTECNASSGSTSPRESEWSGWSIPPSVRCASTLRTASRGGSQPATC